MLVDYDANSTKIAVNIGQVFKLKTVKHKKQTSSVTCISEKNNGTSKTRRINGTSKNKEKVTYGEIRERIITISAIDNADHDPFSTIDLEYNTLDFYNLQ